MASPLSTRTLVLSAAALALALTAPGCTLLGLGAATVGGCALLDRDGDNRITQAELSAGLFERWDTNNDGRLSEAEFNAGVASRDAFASWSGAHRIWDANDDGVLTEAEFEAGVTARRDTAGWVDRRCDELGL